MKKLHRYLPVLLLILALVILFWPSGNSNSGTDTTVPSAQVTTPPSSYSVNDGSGLQLLEPSSAAYVPAGSVDAVQQPQGADSGAQPETTEQPAHTENTNTVQEPQAPVETLLPEDGSYTSKEDVALYLLTYGHLPNNFVTKSEAEKAGWNGGSIEYVLPGKCLGGDRFGNREGQLPNAKGRTWRECDINTLGKRSRGPERLVYSNDGLIYYTSDHYETFTLVYGEP